MREVFEAWIYLRDNLPELVGTFLYTSALVLVAIETIAGIIREEGNSPPLTVEEVNQKESIKIALVWLSLGLVAYCTFSSLVLLRIIPMLYVEWRALTLLILSLFLTSFYFLGIFYLIGKFFPQLIYQGNKGKLIIKRAILATPPENDNTPIWREGPVLFAILMWPGIFLLCALFYWIHNLIN